MIIALDYDDTITLDPEFWLSFIRSAQRRGIVVHCVTWRSEHEPVHHSVSELVQVFYTDLLAKRPFMESKGVYVDVWIDDNPYAVDNNYRL